MWWLWIVAPIAAGLLFVLTGQVDRDALSSIEGFREALGARRKKALAKLSKAEGAKKKTKKSDLRPKRTGVPAELRPMSERAGGGRVLGSYELLPRVAYATFVQGDLGGSSDHQTVLVQLESQAPRFLARPLPWIDGKRAQNTGIEFRKHPEFMEEYLVEADTGEAKRLGKWLTRTLREVMCESGEVWVRAEGKSLALTIYGSIREEKIATLLEIADVFIAEHGAEDGPSIFGEENEDEDEDEDDEDEDDEAPRA